MLYSELGVLVGSVIDSFNGEEVFGKGPEQIYQKFKTCALPISIGFRRPVASSATDPNVIMLKEVTGLETVNFCLRHVDQNNFPRFLRRQLSNFFINLVEMFKLQMVTTRNIETFFFFLFSLYKSGYIIPDNS